jgi:hypothetical protein
VKQVKRKNFFAPKKKIGKLKFVIIKLTIYNSKVNKIIDTDMSSVLEHYNPHSVHSELEWDGLRSSKFGRTKVFLPRKDLITTGKSA